jgi:hypothetical protein
MAMSAIVIAVERKPAKIRRREYRPNCSGQPYPQDLNIWSFDGRGLGNVSRTIPPRRGEIPPCLAR